MQNQFEHNAHYALSFQQGEEKGFAWFFRSLFPALSFYAFKITGDREVGEEIASGAFITVWERHERFSDALSIRKYLYRVVRNGALKHLRSQKQMTSGKAEVIYLYGNEHEKDCFNSLVAAEVSRELLQAINALPTECGKVIRMMFIEGKSIKETAETLGLSPSTVKTQKKRGIESLRKSLGLSPKLLFIGFHFLRLLMGH